MIQSDAIMPYTRRKMLRRTLLVLGLVLAAATARAADFVPGTEDVPLMPGLAPVEGASVVFDKPEGRIVEAAARGKLDRGKVRDFYGATLPQLGWSAASRDAWRREGEVLRLDFRGSDGNLTVGFTLSPQQEPRP
ncbi:MAG TPA: hypothetical protein VN802_03965 [Stellaceae bacterium]|nr:hypothetical protein [Stellaceae bacterium]